MPVITEDRMSRLKAAARRGGSAVVIRGKMLVRPGIGGVAWSFIEAPAQEMVAKVVPAKYAPVATPLLAALLLAQREPQVAAGLAFMAGYRLPAATGMANMFTTTAPAPSALPAPAEAAALMASRVREAVRSDVAALMGGSPQDRYAAVNPRPNTRASSALGLVA